MPRPKRALTKTDVNPDPAAKKPSRSRKAAGASDASTATDCTANHYLVVRKAVSDWRCQILDLLRTRVRLSMQGLDIDSADLTYLGFVAQITRRRL